MVDYYYYYYILRSGVQDTHFTPEFSKNLVGARGGEMFLLPHAI